MKRILLTVACSLMWGLASWAQLPKADVLDIVFHDDGTVTDASPMQNPVTVLGAPRIEKSTQFDMNVLCQTDEDWGEPSPNYVRIGHNDQMEAVAIDRAGLSQVPVNAVKANYGHTMGACGVLETVLSMAAVDAGVVLPTKGFHELGVSKAIRITTSESTTAAKSFVKMVSGFGGGNAALLMSRDEQLDGDRPVKTVHHEVRHTLRLTPDSVTVDGKALDVNATGKAMLTELYKKEVGDYPKFYRMDLLSRVGFIAAELLVKAEEGNVGADSASRVVMLVGRSGSIQADLNYYQSICRPDDYFPSPERFVYTLPNIVAGEIAIRHRYHGETSFLLLPRRDDEAVTTILRSAFLDAETTSVLGGWIDCEDDSRFEAELSIIK